MQQLLGNSCPPSLSYDELLISLCKLGALHGNPACSQPQQTPRIKELDLSHRTFKLPHHPILPAVMLMRRGRCCLSSLFSESPHHPQLFSSIQVPKSPWPASPWATWMSVPEQGSRSAECTIIIIPTIYGDLRNSQAPGQVLCMNNII